MVPRLRRRQTKGAAPTQRYEYETEPSAMIRSRLWLCTGTCCLMIATAMHILAQVLRDISTHTLVTSEELRKNPRRLLRKLIDEKMPARQGGFSHVGKACSPLGRQIE